MSPIVDCGVHYVDVMCQMTGAKPVRVSAVGARLTDEIKPGMYNYGQLQVTFDDGSVGWYEAGWGPMMSEVAFFVKDVIGPKGCVSIVKDPNADVGDGIERHRQPHEDQLHPPAPQRDRRRQESSRSRTSSSTRRTSPIIRGCAIASRRSCCARSGKNVDLTDHMQDAVNSLRIVLAADESVRTGQVVTL